ncbi:L,D-transpeptidase family protein [Streptomyces sp. NPDC005931]|uniref:L,D-transpeptidase family protein n=1 Tax=Streptomyces sp. NPDC005931 TaxID=3364737 RepID=UPI003690E082
MASSSECPYRRGLRVPAVALVLTVAVLTGCGTTTDGTARHTTAAAPAQGPSGTAGTAQGRADTPAEPSAPAPIPGLGPRTLAWIPVDTHQVLVVTGRARDANRSEAVLYRRTASGWREGPRWPARNARKGWTDEHRLGDLRSPVGVFTLSDAGGLLPDPGTRLPYDHSSGFTITGTGFEGEPLAGSFDYVVAIDYNRVPGTSPLDGTRPLGADRGGGIWLHVDHHGPTEGCVSLDRRHMRELLRGLDPGLHPVVVMGDAQSLLR